MTYSVAGNILKSTDSTYLLHKIEKEKNTDKRSWFIFQHGKVFIEMQLVYFIDIFEDNHNTVQDLFVTDLVNEMKNRLLVAKKHKVIPIYINLTQSH